ncbi:MAG: hypothetical protein ACRDWD_06795 [Acidimicrobiia bacterium]
MTALRVAVRGLARHERPPLLILVGLLGALAYLLWLCWAMAYASYDVWGALIVAPVLFAISIPLVLRLTRDDESWVTNLILIALVCKLLAALIRYFVVFEIYGGGDSVEYHEWGSIVAPQFRGGDFDVDIERGVIGTGFMRILTGVVYAFTGTTQMGGFLVYSLLGFWGLYLFYRAFRIGFPAGDHRRYAVLVFFLPSLLFWPSSIGKEAWMTFTLGLAAYGAARLFTQQRGGFALFGLGLVATLMVRPHVALVVAIGAAAAYLVRRPKRPSLLSPAAKGVGILVLVGGAALVMSQVETFFGVSRLDQESVDQILTTTEDRSSQGGSEYELERSSSPVGLAQAAVAVVFRPWPTEVNSGTAAFASLEGMFLLGLLFCSGRRFMSLPWVALRTPYLAMAMTYTVLFIYAFSSVANFGIISRQRVQLYPFLLVLFCVLPGARPPKEEAPEPAMEELSGSTNR